MQRFLSLARGTFAQSLLPEFYKGSYPVSQRLKAVPATAAIQHHENSFKEQKEKSQKPTTSTILRSSPLRQKICTNQEKQHYYSQRGSKNQQKPSIYGKSVFQSSGKLPRVNRVFSVDASHHAAAYRPQKCSALDVCTLGAMWITGSKHCRSSHSRRNKNSRLL
jgi:hypothetical protein